MVLCIENKLLSVFNLYIITVKCIEYFTTLLLFSVNPY